MPNAASIELKRHYRRLSEKETDGLVDAVADLLVSFLKTRSEQGPPSSGTRAGAEEQKCGAPQAIGSGR